MLIFEYNEHVIKVEKSICKCASLSDDDVNAALMHASQLTSIMLMHRN